MMDRKKAKIKNLLGIIDDPTYEDLLFEIVSFLEDENKEDFNRWEASVKTRCRIGSSIEEDLDALVELGWIVHNGYTKYSVVKHPWN